jgi:4-hydroxy-3-polyprenylbenzoate decarboxylase
MKIAVAITGASGVVYGLRLLEFLEEQKIEYVCMLTNAAKKIFEYEVKDGTLDLSKCLKENAIDANIASGSYKMDAMVIAPCSMKTLAAVANGYASNIVTRTADVFIKEGRKLVIVPRETPLSAIHLENMLKLSRLGVTILPAMPGFYNKNESIDDMVDFIVGKVLDALNIDNDLYIRWG